MKAEFYVQFQAERMAGSRRKVRTIRARRLTQGVPYENLPDSALVRFVVEIPDEAFTVPTVNVTIPFEDAGPPKAEAEGVGVMLDPAPA
jgi:hypothetical protein